MQIKIKRVAVPTSEMKAQKLTKKTFFVVFIFFCLQIIYLQEEENFYFFQIFTKLKMLMFIT